MHSLAKLVTASLLAVLAGTAAGNWRATHPSAPAAKTNATPAATLESAPPRTVDPALAAIVRTEPGANRWLHLLAACEEAKASEIPGLIRLAGQDSAAVRMLAAHWADVDPHHMFQSLYAEYLLPDGATEALPFRGAISEALFEQWTKSDPAAVLKALNEVPKFSGRESLRMTAVNQLMKTDPEKGLRAMQDWNVSHYLPDLKKLSEWAGQDPRAAADAVVALQGNYVAGEVIKEVGKAWAKTDPEEALHYAATLKTDSRATLSSEVIRRWAERDLDAAIEFASGQKDAGLRGELGEALVRTWGKTDPAAALAWSQENLRGGARTEAIGNLINSAAEKDVTQAAELVANMEEGPAQTRACSAIFETWFKKKEEHSAALEWLAGLPNEEMRRAAFERVQWDWMWRDPEGVRAFIASPQGSIAPQSMVDQMARNAARKNPEEAMAWAAKLPADKSSSARAAALQGWLALRPDGAQDFARKLPAGPDRDNALRTITDNLSYQDPARAAAWSDSLKGDEQKTARAILEQNAAGTAQRAKTKTP